ncbi:MAG: protein kinase [Planctomycetaceae bacterium]|nr:protein kinase [Planctomycetaceae bacterium]
MPNLNSSSARIFVSVVADEPDAASKLFHRYLARLCRLAQTRLGARIARRLDAEDVVMSAYRSFFINARAGRFWIQESGDLWALLAKITLRKLYRSIEHHSAEMRSVFREVQSTDAYHPHEWVISEQPAVEQAVALADEVESVLRKLPLQHRRVVELRLQGEFMGDIAKDVGLSERTVRRILAEIETQLRQQQGPEENETITVIACPVVETSIATEQANELVHRIPFTDLILKKLIGTGGMGKVYRAVLRTTGGEVAIKFLHKNLQDSPATVRRFRSEAAIIQRIKHPGLVRVIGIGQTKAGIWFIVMNLVHGRSLAERIAEGIPSVEEAVSWTSQVAEAVHRIHEAGIVHCDLKPANILLTGDGKVVVTDFGLARTAFSAGFPENTIAGTAPWMSPEQVDPIFGAIDIRTDVYGLGALLYTLLTGVPPFADRRIPDVLAQIVSQSPVPPSQLRDGIPSQLNDLCMRCLTKSPAQRLASAEKFRLDILSH